ncbi:MAG: TraB/GumN family protein [Ruminiclostridium sp.]
MKLKKLLSALLAAAIVTLSACGTAPAQTAAGTTTTAESTAAAEENTTTEQITTAAETTAATKETTAKETTAAGETTAEVTTQAAPKGGEGKSYNAADYLPENLKATPALWRVTDKETGNSLYMMGTIHITLDSTFPLPDYIMEIYEGSDGVAVEYDIRKIQSDFVVQLKYLSAFALNDGTTIKDHLSPETYEKAKQFLTDCGLYNEAFDLYSAAYWESLITSAALMQLEGADVDTGIDKYFMELASKDGKQVVSIEQLSDQTGALAAMSDRLVDSIISDSIDKIDSMPEAICGLYETWAKGDIESMEEINELEDAEIPEELKEDYGVSKYYLEEKRNIGMAERAKEFLKNGDNLFYMVGFAHFCGEGSVIDLLEKDGYRVERLY